MQKKFIFIACFFLYTSCFAQQYPFVHYTPKDGLVNSRVRKAFQDSKGIMYFMTFGGLSVYDGARFTNYTAQNGLAADMINDLLELGDDSMWIACNTSGLNYLRHGKISTVKTSDGFYPTINKFIRCKNGTIYVLADEGLFRFQQDKFVRLPFTNRRGADAGMFLVDAVEWNQYLFIVSDPGLSSLGPGNFFVFDMRTEKLKAETDEGYISTICKSESNEVYVTGAPGIVQLIDTMEILNQRVRFLPPPHPYKNTGTGINYIYFDNNGNFWLVAQHTKIIKIDPEGAKKEFSMANGLSTNDFSDIFVDREGSAWITMNSSGVDKLVNDNIEKYDEFRNSLVTSVYADQNTDSVFIYSLSGKKLFIVHHDKVSEY